VLGNTATNYQPYNFGSGATIGGSVLGETEVSKNLLETNFGIQVKTFRAGYLCFNDKIINALDTIGYTNSTTLSAADILTNFPFQQRKERSTSGALTNVWEYPMTISDVFSSNPITNINYPQKVAIWLDVINRNMANNAPNVLLIHPTRQYKLTAQQNLISSLPSGVLVTNLELFANYWQKRNLVSFTSTLVNDSLTVIIPSSLLPLDSMISLVVDSGEFLSSIKVIDDLNNPIQITKSNFNTNDVILHFGGFPGIVTSTNEKIISKNSFYVNAFPNPSNTSCTIVFRLDSVSKINIELFDMLGNRLPIINNEDLNIGWQDITFDTSNLPNGIYLYKVSIDSKSVTKKLMVSH
jgi:hypothetical protein